MESRIETIEFLWFFGLAKLLVWLVAAAGILARGIRTNFAPKHWIEETCKLTDLLLDMAMARSAEGNLAAGARCDRI